jgi:hypothetical protein
MNNSLHLLNSSFREIQNEYYSLNGKYYLKQQEVVESKEKSFCVPYESDQLLNQLLLELENETINEIKSK